MFERIKRLPIVAKWLRKRYPYNSTCKICGLPWPSCESHTIMVRECTNSQSGKGFFPVCEWCWNHKSYAENRSAVIATYRMWQRDCDGSYELPYTLREMLVAFHKDWVKTHKDWKDDKAIYGSSAD